MPAHVPKRQANQRDVCVKHWHNFELKIRERADKTCTTVLFSVRMYP